MLSTPSCASAGLRLQRFGIHFVLEMMTDDCTKDFVGYKLTDTDVWKVAQVHVRDVQLFSFYYYFRLFKLLTGLTPVASRLTLLL